MFHICYGDNVFQVSGMLRRFYLVHKKYEFN